MTRLLVPDFVALESYAERNKLEKNMKALIARQDFQDMIASQITDDLKKKYACYEIPKKLLFIDEAFTVENGMLTQTMKLKRRVIWKNTQAGSTSCTGRPDGSRRPRLFKAGRPQAGSRRGCLRENLALLAYGFIS